MKMTKAVLYTMFLSVTNLSAAPLLFLKADRLYQVAGGTNYEMVTSGVTQLVRGSNLFLKEDRLYRVVGNADYEYVTQQVSHVCEGGDYIVKQTRLYRLNANSAEYITAGVTACSQ